MFFPFAAFASFARPSTNSHLPFVIFKPALKHGFDFAQYVVSNRKGGCGRRTWRI